MGQSCCFSRLLRLHFDASRNNDVFLLRAESRYRHTMAWRDVFGKEHARISGYTATISEGEIGKYYPMIYLAGGGASLTREKRQEQYEARERARSAKPAKADAKRAGRGFSTPR